MYRPEEDGAYDGDGPLSQLCSFREEDVVLQMDMFVNVILEVIEFPIRDRKRIADTDRNLKAPGKMTNPMNRIADNLVFTAEFGE